MKLSIRISRSACALCLTIFSLLVACSPDQAPADSADAESKSRGSTLERLTADAEPGNWYTTGRTFGEDRYSPLTEVNTGNADLDRDTLIFSRWNQQNKPEYVQIDLRQLKRR